MRTIKNLLTGKKVYFYLSDEKTGLSFMQEAEKENIKFSDGFLPTQRKAQEIMAVDTDFIICYLGFSGRMCFKSKSESVIRIDYKKYIEGEKEYIINF